MGKPLWQFDTGRAWILCIAKVAIHCTWMGNQRQSPEPLALDSEFENLSSSQGTSSPPIPTMPTRGSYCPCNPRLPGTDSSVPLTSAIQPGPEAAVGTPDRLLPVPGCPRSGTHTSGPWQECGCPTPLQDFNLDSGQPSFVLLCFVIEVKST